MNHEMQVFKTTGLDKSFDDLQEEINNFFINLPQNTKEAYLNDIQKFFKFLSLKKIHPFAVKQIHVEEFMKFISLNGGRILKGTPSPAADRTFNRKLAAISSFYQFLGSKGKIEIDPTQYVKFRKMTLKVETNDLSNEKVAELIDLIPSDNFKHSRDRALIGTLFYTGLRRKEVINLKIDDYKKIKDKKVLKVKVKGGEEFLKPVNPFLEKLIDHYLALRKKEIGFPIASEPIFGSLQEPGIPLSGKGVSLIFERWVRKLHLGYKTSPHSARATFIGALSDMGVSLEENADTVFHKDPRMTKAYIKRRKDLKSSPVFDLDFSKK